MLTANGGMRAVQVGERDSRSPYSILAVGLGWVGLGSVIARQFSWAGALTTV